MNIRLIGAAVRLLAVLPALAATPHLAFSKGGGHGGHIGKGPGRMQESAAAPSVGKTPTLPSNAKQVERSAEKASDKP